MLSPYFGAPLLFVQLDHQARALGEFHISPIKTTIPLHMRIMDEQHFQSGNVDTGFIERVMLGK